jgi:predicted dehydrogenase
MPRENVSRRRILKAGAAAAGLAAMKIKTIAHAARPTLTAGVVGCGRRGTGAAHTILEAARTAGVDVRIAALGDVYRDQAEKLAEDLRQKHGFAIPPSRLFHDFGSFSEVIDAGVDVVLLATPPAFRPQHFEAAVTAGTHCFAEKPAATFAQDCRRFMKAGQESVAKGLTVVAGTQRRHQKAYVDTIQRIHDGAIGDIRALRAYWCGGPLTNGAPRRPGQKDMDFQLKAWYSFVWLSGDQIVEQHVHNLDVCNWAFGTHPVEALASGGCAWRPREEVYGDVYDHCITDFKYGNGVHLLSMCRQYDREACDRNVSEAIVGSRGESNGRSIWTRSGPVFRGAKGENAYVQEHIDFLENIVRPENAELLNESQSLAESTMTAIMGRTAAYTGRRTTWKEMMALNDSRLPALDWEASIPSPAPAVPGRA